MKKLLLASMIAIASAAATIAPADAHVFFGIGVGGYEPSPFYGPYYGGYRGYYEPSAVVRLPVVVTATSLAQVGWSRWSVYWPSLTEKVEMRAAARCAEPACRSL